jgi:signal transduction histidine kinase
MYSGLRLRLLFSYLTVMAAILSVFGTGVYVFFSNNLNRQLDKKLQTLAQSAALSFTEVKNRGSKYLNQVGEVPWRDIFNRDQQSLEWFDAQGNLLGSKGLLKLDSPPHPGASTFKDSVNQVPVRTYTVSVFRDSSNRDQQPSLEGFIRASQSIEEVEAEKNQLLWVLIVGGMMTLILIGFGGLWLTQKAIEPIEESFQKLKQFTADASHELRGPLTAIKASVAVMQSHPERIHPKDAKKLAAVASATTQMRHLIEDLLFLARTDKAVSVPAREQTEISLQEILQYLVVLLEPFAQEKEITLKSDLRKDIQVFGDKVEINRLFSNLLENALQYTPAGGEVSVYLGRNNRFAIVSVRDTGIGIAPEQLSLVFDRFWRADKARSRREGGTGLGLAIAQAIAQRHGGKITLSSQLDVGSCFVVRLPLLVSSKSINQEKSQK